MTSTLISFTRVIAVVASLAALLPGVLWAHQDPAGDVHPTVRVEKGNFAVYFRNNTTTSENPGEGFRVVYSPEGELLAPRHQADSSVMASLGKRSYDLPSTEGNRTYLMPEFHRIHLGRPYYLVRTDGKTERHKIPWPDGTDIDDVSAMTVSGDVLWFSGCPKNQQNFFIYRYPVGSSVPPLEKNLGTVAMIYTFPVASNLVVVGGTVCIVWCRRQDDRLDLVLTKWDGTSKSATDEVLAEKVDFNLSLSIASIGNRLCIAYHHSRSGEYPGQSVISTFFRTIN